MSNDSCHVSVEFQLFTHICHCQVVDSVNPAILLGYFLLKKRLNIGLYSVRGHLQEASHVKMVGEKRASDGANWGGSPASGDKKKKVKVDPAVEKQQQAAVAAAIAAATPQKKKSPAAPDKAGTATAAVVDPSATREGGKKKKLGKKEREKQKLRIAKAQALADEEAGRIAAGGAPAPTVDAATKLEKRSRYTVFVGNLPYDATQQDLFKHFDNFLRDMVLDVRMLHDRGTGESRGTCFVDLKDAISLSKAHKLHHSKLMDRQINVEPSVGGGGKGENRVKKTEEKKRELEDLRKKRIKKELSNPNPRAGAAARGFGAQKRTAQANAAANGGSRRGGGKREGGGDWKGGESKGSGRGGSKTGGSSVVKGEGGSVVKTEGV